MRSSLIVSVILLLLSSAVCSTNAFAHEDWIAPHQFHFTHTEKKRLPYRLSFDATASDRYFHEDRNRFLEDIGGFTLSVMAEGQPHIIPELFTMGQTKNHGEVLLNRAGTYLLAFGRTGGKPMYYSKLRQKDGNGWEYVTLPKNRLNAGQLARREKTGAYYHHAKTFVTAETMTDIWKQPVGHLKEIMPLAHPNAIAINTPFPIQVLHQGVPFSEAKIRLIYEGYQPVSYGSAPYELTADKQGRTEIRFDRPGRWLIETHHKAPAEDQALAESAKYAATLMVEVKE